MIPPEPEIVVNGHRLTEGQAMAVRVAMGNFAIMLTDDDAFIQGVGVELSRNYKNRLTEVHGYMVEKR